jgi:hypothetical protein
MTLSGIQLSIAVTGSSTLSGPKSESSFFLDLFILLSPSSSLLLSLYYVYGLTLFTFYSSSLFTFLSFYNDYPFFITVVVTSSPLLLVSFWLWLGFFFLFLFTGEFYYYVLITSLSVTSFVFRQFNR